MVASRAIAGRICAALIAAALVMPAVAATTVRDPSRSPKREFSLSARGGIGSFTPAAADPRLSAAFRRGGLAANGFRFTPASAAIRLNRAVTVAVRARSNVSRSEVDRVTLNVPSVGIQPVAYNLGVALGWRRFALTGDVARIDTGIQPGSREAMDVGLSYGGRDWSTRLQLAADRPIGYAPPLLGTERSYSVDFGGSYALGRGLDVTAGLRYKMQRDRLEPLADARRDSQAVYVGTAFKF